MACYLRRTVLKYFLTFSNVRKFHLEYYFLRSFSASRNMTIASDARRVFQAGVEAVMPRNMITNFVRKEGDRIFIKEKEYNVKNNVYVVGFGKAVYGMGIEIEHILGDDIQKGILSVPVGTMVSAKEQVTHLQVLEGAANNIPDENAFYAAKEIVKLVQGLKKDDILMVLISGGGSALFPYPLPPITLQEKSQVVRQLSTAGATIWELNSIRKQLSLVKGEGLVHLAQPAQIIGLVLSDIIGNNLEFIASGPTVPNTDESDVGIKILQKYGLTEKVPKSILKCLEERKNDTVVKDRLHFDNVQNVIIGSNTIAIDACLKVASSLDYVPFVLSDEIQGEASEIGFYYADLLRYTCDFIRNFNSPEKDAHFKRIKHILNKLDMTVNEENLLKSFKECNSSNKALCYIIGGEPTVAVKGKGKGGRNQELVLASTIKLYELQQTKAIQSEDELLVLSAGTDGIDGPTDVAGAIAFPNQINASSKDHAAQCLQDNNSYCFFQELNNGEYFVKPGHTGTNVMDIHVLICKPFRKSLGHL